MMNYADLIMINHSGHKKKTCLLHTELSRLTYEDIFKEKSLQRIRAPFVLDFERESKHVEEEENGEKNLKKKRKKKDGERNFVTRIWPLHLIVDVRQRFDIKYVTCYK
jgi:hypothetical protein